MKPLRLVHLLPDLLNLYGDYANLLVLRRELTAANMPAEIVPFAGEEDFDFASAALLYAGPGTEKRLEFALSLLQPHRKALADARTAGTFFLFCGSGVELLSQEIRLPDGTRREGLDLANFTVQRTKNRQTGDCLLASEGNPLAAGFINKSGFLEGVAAPYFQAVLGEGSVLDPHGQKTQGEGVADATLLGTYCLGPLLVKNPWLRREVASKLLYRAGGDPLPPVSEGVGDRAYTITVEELSKRIENR